MTVKAFLSSDEPVYKPSPGKDCPPDCPASKLIQLKLLQAPYECQKCGDVVVGSQSTGDSV